MSASINTNYSQFYKGSEYISSSGSASGKKDTIAHYGFNTADEKGNKVMDKMSREETFRTMNDISSQYEDNVIVEFSGDGLTAFEEHKGKIPLPEEAVREIPEGTFIELEGPEPLTEEQLAIINKSSGDNEEALMRRIDPKAYNEYLAVRKAGKEEGTLEGALAGAKYILKWATEQARKNPDRMDRERENQRALDEVSRRFNNVYVSVGNGDKLSLSGDKDFSIILSEKELNVLKYGSSTEKDKIYQLINDSLKAHFQLRL